MPALPRNCMRNETHVNATDFQNGDWEGVESRLLAASQETYLTDQTTILTEGKGGYYEKRYEKNSVLMSMTAKIKAK